MNKYGQRNVRVLVRQLRALEHIILNLGAKSSPLIKMWQVGRYQQAEFAADLWQVHLGEGSDEYKNPTEFFRRTYLTESLKQLLVGALRRLTGNGATRLFSFKPTSGAEKLTR